MAQNDHWTLLDKTPEKMKADEDIKQAIEGELLSMVSSLSKDCLDKMKSENILVPIAGVFFGNEQAAALPVYEVFKDGLRDKWRWSLEKKHPLPSEFDRFGGVGKLVITPWTDWEDYWKEAVLMIGLPSLCLGILGYALLFI